MSFISPPLSQELQYSKVTFLNESHESGYLKSRYMRHVGCLLAHAIAKRGLIPWQTVGKLEHLQYEQSNTPIHMISGEDRLDVIPLPEAKIDKVPSENEESREDALSGSQYQVRAVVSPGDSTLTKYAAIRGR